MWLKVPDKASKRALSKDLFVIILLIINFIKILAA